MQFFFDLSLVTQYSFLYIIVINILTFFFFGLDKLQARMNHRRTPERVLWTLALLGGTIGALVGMHYFRHKTNKSSFQSVLLFILIIQLILLILPRVL